MIDLATLAATIPTAISAAKDAIGMVKGIKEVTSDSETKTAMSELLGRLIDSQSAMLDAQRAMNEIERYAREVERQLADYRNWDVEAGRYKLVEPYPGSLVYAKKDGLPDDEPMHYLCPACFQKREKSFLQGPGPYAYQYRCDKCEVYYQLRPAPRTDSGFGGY